MRYFAICLLLAASVGHNHNAIDAQSAPKKTGKPLRFIDAHVHVWTSDTAKYPLAPGYKKEDIRPASFTPDDLLKHARPAGVGRIALIQISSYGFDNSYMLDVIAQH